ncbi:MAG TPA: hypothetical protein VK999_01105 [Methylotenera sp.]|nr:hypothetical protein [Methylotenera sp.]
MLFVWIPAYAGMTALDQRSSACICGKKALPCNRFVADAFWFRAFGARLAARFFCGLVLADMPSTGTEGFLSNRADDYRVIGL